MGAWYREEREAILLGTTALREANEEGKMLTVVLVITLSANTPLGRTFRVPVSDMAQCHALETTPGTWWTLRADVTTRCEHEASI